MESLMLKRFVWSAVAMVALGGVWLAGVRAEDGEGARPSTRPAKRDAGTLPSDGPGLPGAEDGEQKQRFPGEPAYRRSLAQAERAYIEQVMRARKQYVKAIRDFQMRATMLPEAAQALDAEIKRVESLPRPRVEPEPSVARREVSISLQVPSPLWRIGFAQAKQVDGEIWVLWRLAQRQGMGAMVISTAEASATLETGELPADATVKHFIMGKGWNWENEGLDATFVSSERAIGEKWAAGKALETVKG